MNFNKWSRSASFRLKIKTRIATASGLAAVAILSAIPAQAIEVGWTDWTSGNPGGGTAVGVITTISGPVNVTYTNEQGYGFIQTGMPDTDYWRNSFGADGSPYTSSVVENIPPAGEMIGLNKAGMQTLTFSETVDNLFFSYVSLNGNGYAFNQDFDILSFASASDPEGPNYSGYWGAGTSYKQVVDLGNGNFEYQLLGTGEPHGTIRFRGAFDSVSWRSMTAEHWNGFTVGIGGLALPPVITSQSESQTLDGGSDVTFTVEVQGSAPFSYQWTKDDLEILAATNSSYSLLNLDAGDSGVYKVVVTNIIGSVSSADINLAVLPFISAHPQSQTNSAGENVSLSVTANGATSFQWRKNGNVITDATNASLDLPDLQNSDAARYDVVVSNIHGSATSSIAWLFVAQEETTSPSVKIVAPKTNERITNNLNIAISGTAKGTDLPLAQVLYSLNGNDYQLADGTSNWLTSVAVNPGIHKIEVKAKDFAGRESKVMSRSFVAVTFSELTLTSIGDGSIIGTYSPYGTPADGATLEVGRAYTVTAIPVVDNLFSNWTGSASSDVAKFTFTMESNMVLTANFVTNLFIARSGIYDGLFSEASGVDFRSSGYFKLKVTPKLRVSGKLLVDGNPVSFSGKMNVDGTASLVTKRRTKVADKPELTVNVALDFASPSDTVTGTISQVDDDAWTADLLGHRMVWSKTNVLEQAQAYTNSYTMIVPSDDEGPMGSGYGVVKVNNQGKTKLVGHVADGHKFKQATSVSKQGYWPLFSPMYVQPYTNALGKVIKESQGFTMGWLQFTNNNGEGNLAPVGEVHWIKTGWTNSTYTTGFSNAIEVIGSRWLPPVRKSGDRAIDMTETILNFSGGDLESPFAAIYSVTTNTTLAVIKPNTPEDYPNSLKSALAAKTGLIKGSFAHPENSAVSTKWFGAMLQDQNFGEGFFMGATNGGKVTLESSAIR